jgi:hypothetical protein
VTVLAVATNEELIVARRAYGKLSAISGQLSAKPTPALFLAES